MGLWADRQQRRLSDALRSKLWLLVPEEPGRDRMVELVRLFDPAARPAGAGRISVDAQRRIYLTRPTTVDPGVVAETHAPPGLRVGYFVQLAGRAGPLEVSVAGREMNELRDSAVLLLNGLGVRLGGSAWPRPKVWEEPLYAAIYTRQPLTTADVPALLDRHVGELMPYEDVTLGSLGISTWRSAGWPLEVELWPRNSPKAWWLPPESVGEWSFHPSQLDVTVLRLPGTAGRTDPDAARALGRMALAVAQATGGVCVDPLKFRMVQPDDLVMR